MKQFVKALPKDGQCFKYLCEKFMQLSEAKLLKEYIFIKPNVRKVMFDPQFELHMTVKEKEVYIAFKHIVNKFLGNKKDPDYQAIVANMLYSRNWDV